MRAPWAPQKSSRERHSVGAAAEKVRGARKHSPAPARASGWFTRIAAPARRVRPPQSGLFQLVQSIRKQHELCMGVNSAYFSLAQFHVVVTTCTREGARGFIPPDRATKQGVGKSEEHPSSCSSREEIWDAPILRKYCLFWLLFGRGICRLCGNQPMQNVVICCTMFDGAAPFASPKERFA